jgi:2'-5' RNA ligase
LAAALRAAAAVRAGRFTLTLDRTGCFPKAGVGWAGCSRSPTGLLLLHTALQAALKAEGFEPESRPYSPHLTLARRMGVPIAEAAIAPVTWQADAFSLVETLPQGGGYAKRAEWPLEGTKN